MTDAVRLMLAAGWPPDSANDQHVTALHWAGFHGDATMARYLIAARAPMEVRDSRHRASPLGWALWGSVNGWRKQTGDYARTVCALLDAGATPPPLDGNLVASDEVKRLIAEKQRSK
jgi:ankyrin repeat protein